MSLFDEQPESREALRQRIQSSSKTEVIRQEMIKHGFWKPEHDFSQEEVDRFLAQEVELTKELRSLAAKQRQLDDPQKALADIQKRRKKESREKQQKRREEKEAQRQARAAQWEETKRSDIIYLGEGVSGGLGQNETDSARLRDGDLPQILNVPALAKELGVTIPELRFLAFHRPVSQVSHYRRFYLPKKRGGQRLISAPMPRLKAVQTAIYENILGRVPCHEAAHGFMAKRSILSNAERHVGRDLVINLDLKDFFPTITFPRIRGLFRQMGYSEKIATILALLCSEPEADQVELDQQNWFVAKGPRVLPQGDPTSPALTNILCYRLDCRLAGIARGLGFTYTRYADDLTFSASGRATGDFKKLMWRARAAIHQEGLVLHPEKVRLMRKGRRQEVTGIVVNEKPGVNRRELKRFRALLFQIEKDGPEGKRWHGSDVNLLASISGFANFVAMVDPEKGKPLQERVQAIHQSHRYRHIIRHPKKEKKLPPPVPGSSLGFVAKLKSVFSRWFGGKS